MSNLLPEAEKEGTLDGPETWLEKEGESLFRFALLRVRNKAIAEDLLQETLLSGIKNWSSFEGRSTVRTWLTGILRNKIIDYYRSQSREQASSVNPLAEMSDIEERNFNKLGIWKDFLSDWAGEPDKHLENKDFYKVFSQCLSKLPENARKVFSLRVLDDLSREEICKVLGLTASNAWVLLHRARLGLRECVEINWINLSR